MGSLRDWLVVLKVFSVWMLICGFVGALIGFICRDRPLPSIILSLTLTSRFSFSSSGARLRVLKTGFPVTPWRAQHI
jgi:hypothetical protein